MTWFLDRWGSLSVVPQNHSILRGVRLLLIIQMVLELRLRVVSLPASVPIPLSNSDFISDGCWWCIWFVKVIYLVVAAEFVELMLCLWSHYDNSLTLCNINIMFVDSSAIKTYWLFVGWRLLLIIQMVLELRLRVVSLPVSVPMPLCQYRTTCSLVAVAFICS